MLTCAQTCNVPHNETLGSQKRWWSRTGSNRRPEACKATALPTELRPQRCCNVGRARLTLVGPGRFELPTSRLSGVRSNQLSYGPARVTLAQLLGRDLSPRQGEPRKRNEDGGAQVLPLGRTRRRCSKMVVKADGQSPRPIKTILRKEVIQPQVPLRLPCYDFTPVADPTVVGCLPCGLAHHLRVEPTPMV